MNSLGTVLIALLVSTLWLPAAADFPTKENRGCVACYHQYLPSECETVFGEEMWPCHSVRMSGNQVWDSECQAPGGDYQEFGGADWGVETCNDAHEYDPQCMGEEEEALASAVDGLEQVETLGDAAETLKAFQDIKGVWVEFNADRSALQVITDGGCNPVPGGKVIEHLPVSEDMIGVWASAFSSQS